MVNEFDDWVTEKNLPRPVIVWTDWHETMINYHLANALKEKQIVLYGLPPNSTHFMQPLDVAVFGPLKAAWKAHASAWMADNQSEIIDLQNFAPVFIELYYAKCTAPKIVNGFKKCGIHPLDSEAPDYSKITTGAMRAGDSIIFEGVDQDRGIGEI